jgi:hypothetical protein
MIAAALFFVFRTLWKGRKEPLEWPVVSATVDEVDSDESDVSGSSGPKYVGAIIYSYRIGGTIYKGMHDFSELYDSPEQAERQVKRWIARTIQVQYDPDRPEISIYIDG